MLPSLRGAAAVRTTTPASRRGALLCLLGLGIPGWAMRPARADAAGDAAAIRHMLPATFDRPEAPLLVDPLVLQADHAIAGWSQGSTGGRALLQRGPHGWRIALCSGDGLKDTALLLRVGVPPQDATALTRALAAAEAGLDPARLALFASFEGVAMMDEAAPHPTPAAPPHH